MRNIAPYVLQSGFLFPDETISQMKEYASLANGYESAVSKALITHVNERQVLWATLILAASLIVLDRLLAARRTA